MDVMFTHGAGLDVHNQTGTACRVSPDPTGREADGIRERGVLGTMTADLRAWSDWWAETGITPVVRESPGAYGRPVYHLLEGDITLCLVQAVPVQQGPGRKTAQADARWLATLRRGRSPISSAWTHRATGSVLR
jgi:transposase